ncbi:hypothetical protein P8X24_08045 [Pyrococcus kukulkanii]|uniref:hypothetical protein n=1 Tax=Pyrococcus kukulkanii TaxID=1609559 RepID=UPI003563F5C9
MATVFTLDLDEDYRKDNPDEQASPDKIESEVMKYVRQGVSIDDILVETTTPDKGFVSIPLKELLSTSHRFGVSTTCCV